VETVYSRVLADQAEIAALQAGDTSKSPLLPGAANVRTRTKIVNGVGYVFAYNYTNLPQPVTFTWQSAPTSVKESKTGQSFAVSGASWQDTFGPYEARIYVIDGAPTFTDVPADHPMFAFIEALAAAGITGGCSTTPPQYCPNNPVTRAQMAVFLLKAKHGLGYGPPAATGLFADVPVANLFAPWIEQLAREDITHGCGPATYCPADPVTRAQMAVFVLKAKHGPGYGPPAATGRFADVPVANPYAPWIEQLAREGITSGCGPTTYCPDDPATRAQMAVFLVRAFQLPH
jgi:hypothetical protein